MSEAARLAAERAYFDLLRAELERAGAGAAAGPLSRELRLRVRCSEPTAEGTRLELAVERRVTTCRIALDAATGAAVSWSLDGLGEGGDDSTPPEAALAIAASAADPEEDAELVTAGYEDSGGELVFRAMWRRAPEEVEVLVNGHTGAAFACARIRSGAP